MPARTNDLYEPRLAEARARLTRDPDLATLFDPGVDPARLELFLIHYCARGVGMTEPVDGWIRRAGERCIALGLVEIGEALVRHARHEAGHHRLMIADTRRLVDRWNAHHPRALSADGLLAAPTTRAVAAYARLHEATIEGDAPFAQVAIEYEVERLSVTLGPQLIGNCLRVLGPEVVASLTFVTEHISLDAGHTELNAKLLDALLAQRPDAAGDLARTGGQALDAYVDFVAECLSDATRELGLMRT